MAMFKRGTATIATHINPKTAGNPQEYLTGYTEGLKAAGDLETDLTDKSASYVEGFNTATLSRVMANKAAEAADAP